MYRLAIKLVANGYSKIRLSFRTRCCGPQSSLSRGVVLKLSANAGGKDESVRCFRSCQAQSLPLRAIRCNDSNRYANGTEREMRGQVYVGRGVRRRRRRIVYRLPVWECIKQSDARAVPMTPASTTPPEAKSGLEWGSVPKWSERCIRRRRCWMVRCLRCAGALCWAGAQCWFRRRRRSHERDT